jgi:hypothetical protein
MAFLEVLGARTIISGVAPTKITLAGNVNAGDLLGYNSGWVISASATTIQPLLIAGSSANSGESIIAYPMAVVRTTNLVANVATVGSKVALTDGGLLQPAGAGLPDVGYVASIGSDSLSAVVCLCPMIPQVTVVRS